MTIVSGRLVKPGSMERDEDWRDSTFSICGKDADFHRFEPKLIRTPYRTHLDDHATVKAKR